MGNKFDAEGHEIYKGAIDAVAQYIQGQMHGRGGAFLADAKITLADFTAAGFIFGAIFNDAFP